jgi:hypothetical protein
MPKGLDIAGHRVGKRIQYRGDLFWIFDLLKKQEIARVLFGQGFKALYKLRTQVLFMDIPYKQGKLVREGVLLMDKSLRENTWCKNR